MLEETGIPTEEQLLQALPPPERRSRGPVAVFECFQRIPCNPCYTACKVGAVKKFEDINDLPSVDYDKCTGCGLCVAACPGLAIFVIDETYSPTETLIKLPYEFLPLPRVGELVSALNRAGEAVGVARVVRVQSSKNKTQVVWVTVPKEIAQEVRNIRVSPAAENKDKEEFWRPAADEEALTIVCRCEDVPLEEIRSLLAQGLTTATELKRRSRCSMGPCQGKTCLPLTLQEISQATGQPMDSLRPPTNRPPVKPVKLKALGSKE